MNTETKRVQLVSVNGWTQPTQFHFQVVDYWPAPHGDSGAFIFVKDESPASAEFFKHMCMWGGASRYWPSNVGPDIDHSVRGYEIHRDLLPAIKTFIERTKRHRPDDLKTLD